MTTGRFHRLICAAITVLAIFGNSVGAARADGQPQRAYLDVTLNGDDLGNVLVVLGSGDVLVHAGELVEAGLEAPAAAMRDVAADRFVSVRALAPAARYTVDADALTLKVSLPAELFHAQHLDIGSEAQARRLSPVAGGAFLNYALTGASGASRPIDLSGQLGVSIARGVFETTISRNAESGQFRTSNVAFTRDDFNHAQRYVAGASFVDMDDFAGLGGAVYIDGLSIHRMLAINPNLIRRSATGVSGVATNASTVDVYVNGALVRHEQISPGAFQLTNIPMQDGINRTSVVIRDAFGNQQTIDRAGYSGADLLPRATAQFNFGAGRQVDTGFGVVAGRYDIGLTDGLTLSAHALQSPRVQNGGLALALALPFGELSATGALSGGSTAGAIATGAGVGTRLNGSAYGFNFSRSSGRFVGGLSIVGQAASYSSASLSPLDDRALFQTHAYAQLALRPGGPSLGLRVNSTKFRDSAATSQAELEYSTPLMRNTNVSIEAGRGTVGAISGLTWSARVDAVLGGKLRVDYSAGSGNGGSSPQYQIVRDNPHELGTSYSAQIGAADGQSAVNVQLVHRDTLGTLAVDVARSEGRSQIDATLSGAVAFVGGGWYLSRPIRDGFGVIDLDGISGVHAYLNGDPLGKTNSRGRLLVPNLPSYSANALSVESEDLPSDTLLENMSLDVVPSYHSGSIVHFAPRRVRAFTAHVRFAGEVSATPEYGKIVLTGPRGDVTADIGTGGLLYFDRLEPGTYEARASSPLGSCTTRLIIPRATTALTNLGTLLCTREIR
jgi:outer membrane usher protein